MNKLIEILDTIQWKIRHWVSELIWAIRYRTIDKYHVIKIHSLKPDYYDTDTRLLHGMFDLLVDFIEGEKAHMELVFGEKKTWKEKFYFKFLPSCLTPRSRERGLRYLDWEISLKDTPTQFPEEIPIYKSQSEIAQTIKDLYIWWKDVRPLRKDPSDLAGLSDFFNKHREKIHKFRKCEDSECFEMYSELTEDEKTEEHRLLMLSVKIEEDQNKEDEEMLIKLIKIRRSLWT